MGKNIDKNISKNLSGKYTLKLLDHAKKSATDTFKTTSEKVIQKAAEATGDLIGNKIADRNAILWKSSPQNNSETITNEDDKQILKERYISPKDRQKFIDDLRFI